MHNRCGEFRCEYERSCEEFYASINTTKSVPEIIIDELSNHK